MKYPLLVFCLSALIARCGSKEKASESIVIPTIPASYVALDLSKTGLSASLMTPAGASAEKSTLSDNEGTRTYYIVRPFSMPSDAADRTRTISAKLEIYTTQLPIEKHKEILRSMPSLGWKFWLLDEPDLSVFAARPGNAIGQPIREKDLEVYHFLFIKRGKDGQQYIVRSSSSVDYTKNEMLQLLAIAKSLQL